MLWILAIRHDLIVFCSFQLCHSFSWYSMLGMLMYNSSITWYSNLTNVFCAPRVLIALFFILSIALQIFFLYFSYFLIFLSFRLLPDRKLKSLFQHPLDSLPETKDGYSLLLFWYWEECLKQRYELAYILSFFLFYLLAWVFHHEIHNSIKQESCMLLPLAFLCSAASLQSKLFHRGLTQHYVRARF